MATDCKSYDFSTIERYWQSFWAKTKPFRAVDFSEKPTFYVMDMFPYPSGEGLHIGHPEGFTATDILARYKKAQGFNVLHPMGWDAFGLPAEQYAISTGTHPRETTQNNIVNFRGQIERIGLAIDWEREVNTTDPGYYRWTQWIFIQLFRHGLAYVDKRPVWWCPALKTVLANEEVINGLSERGSHPVVRRSLRQWILKITAYADRLLAGLEGLDWPDSTKRQQQAWIGRSEGAQIEFAIENHPNESIEVFTTRPDTLFGATYMVLAPEHRLVDKLTSRKQGEAVAQYKSKASRKSDLNRTDLAKEKTGVFTGSFAVNPVNENRIPIWVADYVLLSYGTGAVMAVPAHDERDFEFAQCFDLPIVRVIERKQGQGNGSPANLPYTGHGVMVHSNGYSGLDSEVGKQRIIQDLEATGKGKAAINYKLHDWLFSRQRYWGEPIPIVWVNPDAYLKARDTENGAVAALLPEEPVFFEEKGHKHFALPVPEEHLPLILPQTDSFEPSGNGDSPLANIAWWTDIWFDVESGESISAEQEKPSGSNWVRGQRETNTMPQWAGSCWYYLRYCDPDNEKQLISPAKERYWGTPDLYVGGAEHAVLHLFYVRFWHQFLYDIGVVSHSEPFGRVFHQGMILGEDGNKMSKSRGNVINPDKTIEGYGADSLRLYEMFIGPLEDMKPWSEKGIEGVYRFLRRIWRVIIDRDGQVHGNIHDGDERNAETDRLLHQTIKKVTEDIERLRFNTAISQMMIFSNHLQKAESIARSTLTDFLRTLAPFAPHICEELWARLRGIPSIVSAPWPDYDPARIATDMEKLIIQVNGKLRGDTMIVKGAGEEVALREARQHPRVAAHLKGKRIRKVIYVPGRVLNIVVASGE